jgi:4-amino-4-deoxy-L-arabinose transferase-like glycosyltransferase
MTGVAGRLAALCSPRWTHLLILALPFVVVIAGWHGLSHPFNTYQAGDELTHYGIVHTVVAQWPRPLLSGYLAWSGPFVYWVLATLSLPFGGSLVAVRLVVAVLSWATCAVAYVLLRDRLRVRPPEALALALLLALSPFFFGQSFRVLTDNPTWFFVVLALERLFAYVQRPRLWRFAEFAACMAAATTMRQVTLWLAAPGLVALLSVPAPRRRRLIGVGMLALGTVPLIALLLYWGGPLPPGPGGTAAASSLAAAARTRNLLLSLGVVGLYGALMLPAAAGADWGRRARAHRAWPAVLVLPAVVAAGLLAAGLLDSVHAGMGLIEHVGMKLPQLAGVSLLWWVLVPLGAAVTAGLVATRLSEVRTRLLVVVLLGVLVSAMANPVWYQRYVDFPILLAFAGLAAAAGRSLGRADRMRWLVAGLIALVWLERFLV